MAKAKILVVDDEVVVLGAVTKALKKTEYVIDTAQRNVDIDVLPGDEANVVYPNKGGKLPIAILSVQAQDALSEQGTKWIKDQQSTKVSGDLVALQLEYTIYRQANSQEAFQASNSLLRGAAGHVGNQLRVASESAVHYTRRINGPEIPDFESRPRRGNNACTRP